MATMKRSKNKSNGTPAKSAVPVLNASARNLDVQNAVRAHAYMLYEQGGREHGHDLRDWLRAEGEVLTRLST